MKKALKWTAIVLATVFVLLQLRQPDRANPPVRPERGIEATLGVPDEVLPILKRACYDCHSNETRWPWYGYVAPVSYKVAHDVEEGRDELNFSEWSGYGKHEAADRLGEMCEELRSGKMPIRPYRLLHAGARLEPREVRAICEWTAAASARLVAP